MPILSAEPVQEKDKIKIELEKNLLSEIKDYMQWAGINDLSFFFKEAGIFVLSKDKEWAQYKKINK